jgi:hypothetical protein
MGVLDDIGMQVNNATFINTITDLKARQFDTVLFNNGSVDTVDSRLTIADQQGFQVISGGMGTLYDQFYWTNLPATIDNARAVVYPIADRLKIHPSELGYNVADDAGVQSSTLPDFQTKQMLAIQAFRERDGGHIATTTLTPGFEWMYSKSEADALLHYYYPAKQRNQLCDFYATDDGAAGGGYYGNSGANSFWGAINLARLRRDLKNPLHPLWLVAQTHGSSTLVDPNAPPDALRTPAMEELRLQEWLALAEGVDGFFWFIYSTLPSGQGSWIGLKDNQPLYTEATDLMQRLGPLRSILMATTPVEDQYTVTAGTNLDYRFRPYGRTHRSRSSGKYYVFVVNKACSAQNLTVASSSLGGQLRDVESAQIYSLGQPIAFRGGDGRLFEVLHPSGAFRAYEPINLLDNPGFEAGSTVPDSWTAPLGVRDTTVSHAGGASLRVTGSADSLVYQNVNLQADTLYSLAFWAKTRSVSGSGVSAKYVELSPHMGANRGEAERVSGTTDWKYVYYIFYTPHNFSGSGSSGRFDIYFKQSSGTSWIDDVKLCEGNCVTPSPTATPTPAPCPLPFADVDLANPFYRHIQCLYCQGIVGGYNDGTFRPGSNITRAQVAKFVSNAAHYADSIPPTQQTFSDVPPSNPFWLFIERAYAHGVINGYSDHTFRPSNNVTRGQMAKFVANAAGYTEAIPPTQQSFTDVLFSDPFWAFVERAYAHAVISGYGDRTFRPRASVTRGQTSKFISNAFLPGCAAR